MKGLGVVLILFFGLAAIPSVVEFARTVDTSSSGSALVAQSTTTAAGQSLTATTTATTSTTTPADENPLLESPVTPAQEVWCQANAENRVYVMLAASILGLHDFDEAAAKRYIAGDSTSADVDLLNVQRDGWHEGYAWTHVYSRGLGDPYLGTGPPREASNVTPSNWALACAAAYGD